MTSRTSALTRDRSGSWLTILNQDDPVVAAHEDLAAARRERGLALDGVGTALIRARGHGDALADDLCAGSGHVVLVPLLDVTPEIRRRVASLVDGKRVGVGRDVLNVGVARVHAGVANRPVARAREPHASAQHRHTDPGRAPRASPRGRAEGTASRAPRWCPSSRPRGRRWRPSGRTPSAAPGVRRLRRTRWRPETTRAREASARQPLTRAAVVIATRPSSRLGVAAGDDEVVVGTGDGERPPASKLGRWQRRRCRPRSTRSARGPRRSPGEPPTSRARAEERPRAARGPPRPRSEAPRPGGGLGEPSPGRPRTRSGAPGSSGPPLAAGPGPRTSGAEGTG